MKTGTGSEKSRVSRIVEHAPDEATADPAVAAIAADDHRLDLEALVVAEEPGEADDRAVLFGDPRAHELRVGPVGVEVGAGVAAADGLVVVEVAVVLRQLAPQPATSLGVFVSIGPDLHLRASLSVPRRLVYAIRDSRRGRSSVGRATDF